MPYKGSGPAATDVAGGQVAFAFDAIAPHLPHIKSNRTRLLASISPKRLAMFPEAPTMAEIGYPQVAASIWYGMMAPAGLPKPIIAKLNAETNRVLGMQEVKDRMETSWPTRASTPRRRTRRTISSNSSVMNWRSGGRW